MFERVISAASAARDAINAIKALPNAIEELKRIAEVERYKYELDASDAEIERLKAVINDLNAKLDWLTRWRKQSDTPCPFPDDYRVEWSPYMIDNHESLMCIASRLASANSWRPSVGCLGLYEEFKHV